MPGKKIGRYLPSTLVRKVMVGTFFQNRFSEKIQQRILLLYIPVYYVLPRTGILNVTNIFCSTAESTVQTVQIES